MGKYVNITTVILSLVTLFMGITCMICLPDQVAVQWNYDGEVTTVISRFSAVAVGIVVGMAGIIVGFFLATAVAPTKRNFSEKINSIIRNSCLVMAVAVSLVGVAVMVVFLIMNS